MFLLVAYYECVFYYECVAVQLLCNIMTFCLFVCYLFTTLVPNGESNHARPKWVVGKQAYEHPL